MGSGGKSGGGQTVTQQSGPPQQFLDAYSQLVKQAQGVGGQPLQQYQGPIVAPLSSGQQSGLQIMGDAIDQLAAFGNPASPYITQAGNYFGQATQPLWSGVQQFSPQAISAYQNPYTQQVTQATQNLFNQQNQIQQNQLVGNAITSGAFGGDRAAVAQAVLAGQQQLSEAPTLANIQQQGYAQAQQEFNQQQQAQLGANEANAWLNSQAAFGTGQLGQEQFNTQLGGLNAALGAGQAALSAGALEQAQAQAGLNVPYQQFIQQQAYPFQTTGWLSNIVEGLGGASGGTATTTYPGPSMSSQILGGGLAGAGILGQTGAFGNSGYLTGSGGLFGSGGAGKAGGAAGAGSVGLGSVGGGYTADAVAQSALLAGVRRGGRIPHRADGGIVIPFPRRQSGGYTPGMLPFGMPSNDNGQSQAATGTYGGGVAPPDVSVSYVPNVSSAPSQGMGPPKPGAVDQSRLDQGLLKDTSGEFAALKDFKGSMADMQTSARGGIIGYDDGGEVGGPDDQFAGVASWPGAIMRALTPNTSAPIPVGEGGVFIQPGSYAPTPTARPDAFAGASAPDYGAGYNPPPPAVVTSHGVSDSPTRPALPPPPPPRPDNDGGIAPPSADAGARGVNPYLTNYRPRASQGEPSLKPDPWEAVTQAGAAMLSSRSPYFGVALGEGLRAGETNYAQQKKENAALQEKQAEAADTGSYRKATLDQQAQRFSDAASEALARLQAETKHYEDEAEYRRQYLEQGKYSLIPGSGQDENGKTVQGAYKFNAKTGDFEFQPGVSVTGKGGQGATNALVQQLIADGTAKDTASALAIIRDPAGKGAGAVRAAQERLAIAAAKADPSRTLEEWRAYYGLGAPGAAAPAAAAAPPIPKPLTGINGLQYSPSRKQYRDPATGNVYDQNGEPVE